MPITNSNNNTHTTTLNSDNNTQRLTLNSEPKKFITLNYIPNLSEKLTKTITGTHKTFKTSYKPIKTVRKTLFSKLKTKIDPSEKSGVVYKIPCGQCNKLYVGETSKRLKTRKNQHKNDLKNIEENPNRTAILQHIEQTNHIFKYDEIEIMDYEKNMNRRRILESTYITSLLPYAINIKSDTNNLSNQFTSIIEQYSRTSSKIKRHKGLQRNVNNSNIG